MNAPAISLNAFERIAAIADRNNIPLVDICELCGIIRDDILSQGGTVPDEVPAADPDYLSNCPEGMDTVLGFLAKYHPEVLELIDKEAEATLRDGYWLTHRCREQGIKPVKVEAPRFLLQQGIFEVNCYPVELLRKRFQT